MRYYILRAQDNGWPNGCSSERLNCLANSFNLLKRMPYIFNESQNKLNFSSPFQDCSQVPTDGKRSISRSNRSYGVYDDSLTHLNPPVTSEIKDGQWLGVEVKSEGEGGKVIVCAHR